MQRFLPNSASSICAGERRGVSSRGCLDEDPLTLCASCRHDLYAHGRSCVAIKGPSGVRQDGERRRESQRVLSTSRGRPGIQMVSVFVLQRNSQPPYHR